MLRASTSTKFGAMSAQNRMKSALGASTSAVWPTRWTERPTKSTLGGRTLTLFGRTLTEFRMKLAIRASTLSEKLQIVAFGGGMWGWGCCFFVPLAEAKRQWMCVVQDFSLPLCFSQRNGEKNPSYFAASASGAFGLRPGKRVCISL